MQDSVAGVSPRVESKTGWRRWVRLLERLDEAAWTGSCWLGLILAAECMLLLLQARNRPLWYDELLTYHVSSLQPFSLLYQALDAGVDGMPPAYYIVVRLARVFSSDAQLALRLPSIAGYL